MDSILTSVKKKLGAEESYTHFDDDIIDAINTVFFELMQVGVGPENGFVIEDAKNVWDDFLEPGPLQQVVRTYVALKVKLIFDPPQNTGMIDAINRQIDRLEWRMNVAVDPGKEQE